MRKLGAVLVVVSVALLALPAAAQMPAPDTITRVFWVKAKPGMEKQFEEGRKKHIEFHHKQSDPWAWHVYTVETGEDAGQVVAITPNHKWEDFDARAEFDKLDDADYEVNVAPYAAEAGNAFYLMRADLSNPRPGDPAPFSSVIHFFFKIGKVDDAEYVIKKFNDAIAKTNWPTKGWAWYQLINGGVGPHWVLVLPREKWTDLNPPEKPFDKMMEDAYGREEAERLFELWDSAIKSVSTEIVVYRPELSHIPGKKM